MPYHLLNLDQLTHPRLDEAIDFARVRNPHFLTLTRARKRSQRVSTSIFATNQSPYEKLYEMLISDEGTGYYKLGVAVLGELLGGNLDEINRLAEHKVLISAVRLYLTLKVKGAFYLSEDGSHDDIRKVISQLMFMHNEYVESTIIHLLNSMATYGLFTRNPDFLNFHFNLDDYYNALLHVAANNKSSAVVACLLHYGANPDVVNRDGRYPIHLATLREDGDASVIACLLIAALKRSVPTQDVLNEELIAEALFLFNMSIERRISVCREIVTKQLVENLDLNKMSTFIYEKARVIWHEELILTAKINDGGFGVVYEASIKSYNNQVNKVAVKLDSNSDIHYETRDEVSILRLLNHSNVVKLLYPIERMIHGKYYFGYAMELANDSLGNFVFNHTLEVIDACAYVFHKQINAGLRYIHGEGMVHNDIKPQNILIQYATHFNDATLKIADFGAAAYQGHIPARRKTTTRFASPEAFDIKKPLQPTSDTYSHGCMIGFCYTKIRPWEELDDDKVEANNFEKEAPTFNNVNIPVHANTLMFWCCRPKPEERPSHDEFDAYLEAYFRHD